LVSLSAELESLQYGLMGLALPAVAATTAIAAISTATTAITAITTATAISTATTIAAPTIATATAVAPTAAATTTTAFSGSGFVDTDHAPHPFDVLKVVNGLLFGRIVG
jgi:hypothetical protein